MSWTRLKTLFNKWDKHPTCGISGKIWFNALSILDSKSVIYLWGLACVSRCTSVNISTYVALFLFCNSAYAPTIFRWFVNLWTEYNCINWNGLDLKVPSKKLSRELLRKWKLSSVPNKRMQSGRPLSYKRNCWSKTSTV